MLECDDGRAALLLCRLPLSADPSTKLSSRDGAESRGRVDALHLVSSYSRVACCCSGSSPHDAGTRHSRAFEAKHVVAYLFPLSHDLLRPQLLVSMSAASTIALSLHGVIARGIRTMCLPDGTRRLSVPTSPFLLWRGSWPLSPRRG